MKLRVGLVTEGPTDQIVLRELLQSHIKTKRPNVQLEFVALQPTPDRTSSGYQGGWFVVYKWCLDNTPQSRAGQLLSGALFADGMSDQQCDVIVVHLDTDAIAEYRPHHQVPDEPDLYAQPNIRAEFVRRILEQWLWPNGAVADDKHIAAPIVEAVETWLVAALTDVEAPEWFLDPGRQLATHEASRRGRSLPSTFKGMNKSTDRYRRLASRAAICVEKVYLGCSMFRTLVDSLIAFADSEAQKP
jgi:hypothetical protein